MIIASQAACALMLFCFFRVIIDSIYKRPGRKANKAFDNAVVVKKSFTAVLKDSFINPFAALIEPLIIMNDTKESKLSASLKRAGINDTPRMYYAKAVISSLLLLPLPLLFYVLGMTLFVPLSALLIAAVFFYMAGGYMSALKKKRSTIERVLPSFIRAVLYKLNERSSGVVKADLISIFESYLVVAHPVFVYDVSILILEMKSKDSETALRNFNNRLGIPEVGFLCNALIGITRGEHQNDVLSNLAHEIDVKSKEHIRRELEKRPAKVFRACIPLFVISFAAIGYTLITALILGFSGMF